MQNMDVIKLFFSKMKCSNCQNNFSGDDVTILRSEDNYTVVRVFCETCEKNIGLAILGLDKECMADSLKQIETKEPESEQSEKPIAANSTPIDYDDVLNAHEFIRGLGDDWLKFIPAEYKE